MSFSCGVVVLRFAKDSAILELQVPPLRLARWLAPDFGRDDKLFSTAKFCVKNLAAAR